MTTRRYALRDDQWERIKDLLPGRAGYVGVTAFIQQAVCRSSALSLPGRYPLARLTDTLWRLPDGSHALESMVKNRDVGANISALGKRCRQRICNEQLHDCGRSLFPVRGQRGGARIRSNWSQPRWAEHQDSCGGGCSLAILSAFT